MNTEQRFTKLLSATSGQLAIIDALFEEQTEPVKHSYKLFNMGDACKDWASAELLCGGSYRPKH